MNTSQSSCKDKRLRLPSVFCLLIIIALCANAFSLQRPKPAAKSQKSQPRKSPPKQSTKTTTAEPAPQSPSEALDRARATSSQQERIDLLEKFLVTYRGSELEPEARELLMREYALRGEQMLREANPHAAMQAFRSVFRVAPAVITDKVFGQFIFPLPMAMNAFGYRAESAELMRSFESRFESDPNRLIEIGFFYVQIEAPFEAVRVLEHAVRLAPDDHRAHNTLGTAYLIGLRLDDAASEFQRAIELDPKDEYANLNLANLARARGDYEGAVNYYRRQLAIKPDDPEAHGGLSIALLALGRDEEAEPEIKREMELAPGDYRFLTQLAYFYTTRKKWEQARQLIERAVRIEPRYAWAFIAKANIDLLEGKYGDALSTLIGAQGHGNFATLSFELIKALMAVDGYDQALEVMNPVFTINSDGEFEALLGGAVKARSQRLDLLIERERQAALFLNDHPTTTLQYRLAEALARIDHYTKMALAARKPTQTTATRRRARQTESASQQEDLKNATRPRRAQPAGEDNSNAELSAGADASLPGIEQLLAAIKTFTTLDDGRQAFRMIWVSRRLTENSLALDAAEQLARRAIAMADKATEPENSMRDAPLLDRAGRRSVFLGRAYDALGWALFKKGNTQSAVQALTRSLENYPPSAERKAAMWHLAVATQEMGDERRALDLYIASYEANAPTSSVRRAQIEALYKKLNGSLAGLDDKLRQQ
ncbi:MAG TPA: tetratricopeptide repeat protein [Blastocatellia bacterium]|nr:tetratricopeptide repeat protein [Blastocatellia bacterium]